MKPIPIPPKQVTLKTPPVSPVETLQAVYVAPVVSYTPPVSVSPNCGPDSMMAYIYTVESGCRTNAYNPGGCRGLGQACPGSKLPCSDTDWACQDAWFRNYAVAAYGSIYNAYIFRTTHNWW